MATKNAEGNAAYHQSLSR